MFPCWRENRFIGMSCMSDIISSCRGRQLEEAECFYDAQVNNEIRRLLYESRSVRISCLFHV